MIEFKAECGHTVRARDEDAGGLVRCSYCGRPANVPDNVGDDLDFLFSDVEQGEEDGARGKKGKRRGRQRAARRARPGEFKPFAVVLRLCYAALLIIIVVIVAKKFVFPLFKEGGLQDRTGAIKRPVAQRTPARRHEAPSESTAELPGLLAREKLVGLYVNSTPVGATVYCLESSKAPAQGRINKVQGCAQFRAGDGITHLHDGSYVLEIAFPWNDPKLTIFSNYMEFRRKIGNASPEKRNILVNEFFLPDAGTAFIDETEDQIYVVRQYRNVELNNRKSKGVRALFLPRILNPGENSFSIEELVASYLPQNRSYAFDEAYVRGELLFYDVRESDLPFVIEALARIGVIPYVTPDQHTRLFKIDIHDGSFAVRTIRKPTP